MIVDRDKALDDARYLFMQSKWHKAYTPDEFYAYLVLPCNKNMIRLYYVNERPVGLVTWVWFTPKQGEEFLDFKYLPIEDDYEYKEGRELWGIEFIAPFGHARQVMRAIRKETENIYGPDKMVKWRRAQNPHKVIERKVC